MKTWHWIAILIFLVIAAVFGTMSYTNKQYEIVKGSDGKAVQTNGKDTYTRSK